MAIEFWWGYGMGIISALLLIAVLTAVIIMWGGAALRRIEKEDSSVLWVECPGNGEMITTPVCRARRMSFHEGCRHCVLHTGMAAEGITAA